jgi:hypothetical protein
MMMRLIGRCDVFRRQGASDSKLVAKCVGNKLLERRGIRLPPEAADSLFALNAFYPMHTPLNAVGFADRSGSDYVISDRVDEPLAVKLGSIAHRSDVGFGGGTAPHLALDSSRQSGFCRHRHSFGSCLIVRFGPLLSSMLFQIKPVDPMTFALVSALLLIVAFLGCYFPARRGSRMNPVDALRSE